MASRLRTIRMRPRNLDARQRPRGYDPNEKQSPQDALRAGDPVPEQFTADASRGGAAVPMGRVDPDMQIEDEDARRGKLFADVKATPMARR